MAFVFRSQDKPKKKQNLGPGSYIQLNTYNYSPNKQPFLISSQRFKILSKQSSIPPHIYTQEKPDIETRPTSVFQSLTKRIVFSKNQKTPDPGTQHKNNEVKDYKSQAMGLIKEILKLGKHKAIPSIPQKTNEFGYTILSNKSLLKNQSYQMRFDGNSSNSIGPDRYIMKQFSDRVKQIGAIRFNKNNKLRFYKQQKTNVGPGYYHIQKFPNLQNMTNSACFLSKTPKVFNQKGQIITPFMKSNCKFSSTQNDNQQQFPDTVPGPGAYLIKPKIFKQCKNKKSVIGKQKRFNQLKDNFQQLLLTNVTNQKGVKFNKSQRFQKNIGQNLGPTSYKIKDGLKYKLIKKFKKGYKGKFCCLQQRQKLHKNNDIPFYIRNEKKIQEKLMSFFKNQTLRNVFQIISKILLLGNCNKDFYNINKVERSQYTYNNVPFNSSDPRFKNQVPIQNTQLKNLTYLYINKNKNMSHNMFSKVCKKKQKNIVKKKEEIPDPGVYLFYQYYYNNQNNWLKPSFNLIYAQIKQN